MTQPLRLLTNREALHSDPQEAILQQAITLACDQVHHPVPKASAVVRPAVPRRLEGAASVELPATLGRIWSTIQSQEPT